ncbi:TlpA family protein disulfide reductase [Tenacibaculum maritimum]|uniref:Thioredoxin domain-containing protein n=2 Tax=Tenacibaculum maritimum TaxID=107401 RepID=A0A2H1EBU3_9FLAO|nr:thioredoxin-like domain-containing protein [Tenacibaculum maritimum]SFZ84043.1 Thioredoxin domain-containing protein [Tenacibaculum maritimum NCIMB 2154]
MKYYLILFIFFTSCAVFQPKKFNDLSLEEKMVTTARDTITLGEVLEENSGKDSFIQVYATYCPFSQDSFKEVILLQEKYKDVNYIFLSVDHSYYDWKRGLEKMKVKGQQYYIPKKGKGALGKFLKLKTIPRFILLNKEGKIRVYNTADVLKIKRKLH